MWLMYKNKEEQANMQVEKDVIYDEAHDLPVDIYVPDAANGGAVIYAHGGGWFRGDK